MAMNLIPGYEESCNYSGQRFSNIEMFHDWNISIPNPTGLFKGIKLKKSQKRLDDVSARLSVLSRDCQGVYGTNGFQKFLDECATPGIHVQRSSHGLMVRVYSALDVSTCFDSFRYMIPVNEVRTNSKAMEKIARVVTGFRDTVEDISRTVKSVAPGLIVEESKRIDYLDFYKDMD